MRIHTTGKVTDNLHVLGSSAYPIYLLDLPQQPAIFESGISCLGQVYVEAVRSVLGDRQPAYLFISHAHWDHAGSAAYLKQAFPDMQIAASPLAAALSSGLGSKGHHPDRSEGLSQSLKTVSIIPPDRGAFPDFRGRPTAARRSGGGDRRPLACRCWPHPAIPATT